MSLLAAHRDVEGATAPDHRSTSQKESPLSNQLTTAKIQKKSYTRADGTRVRAHSAVVHRSTGGTPSPVGGPSAGPLTKAPTGANALGIRPPERETADEFRARYDAELAAAETPEEWRAVAQRNERIDARYFGEELTTARPGSGPMYIEGDSETDSVFDRQQARSLAFARLYEEKFGDSRKADEIRTAEEAKAYAQMKNEKALGWRGATAIADRARLVTAGWLDEDDAEAADQETRVALALAAANPANTAEQLAEYAKTDSDLVIAEVVGHANTSTATLVGLSRRDPLAALTAARRADAPSDFLAENAGSTYPNIRAAVAGHPSTPAATLRELSRDDDRDVQTALAANPSSPVSALKKLSDGSGSVAATAAWRRLRDRTV